MKWLLDQNAMRGEVDATLPFARDADDAGEVVDRQGIVFAKIGAAYLGQATGLAFEILTDDVNEDTKFFLVHFTRLLTVRPWPR